MALYDVSTSEKKTNPELVSGGTLYADAPIGTIIPFGGSSDKIASGYLLCDGTAVSRTTYAELFAVIGTSFGSGNGSTTFNLPDMRESVPKGAGLTGKTVGNHVSASGLVVGEFIDDRIQASNNAASIVPSYNWAVSAGGTAGYTGKSNIRYGVTTEVKSVGVNYIIKAKMIGVPADFVQSMGEFEKYSTDEVLTNKTWIDGKPIYRKVVPIPSIGTVAVGQLFNLAFDRSGIKDVINTETVLKNSAGNDYPHWGVVVSVISDSIQIQWLGSGELSTGYVILEYTKTN